MLRPDGTYARAAAGDGAAASQPDGAAARWPRRATALADEGRRTARRSIAIRGADATATANRCATGAKRKKKKSSSAEVIGAAVHAAARAAARLGSARRA